MAVTGVLLFRGVEVSRRMFQAPEAAGGENDQYTDTSELACDRSGFRRRRNAWLRRPVLGDGESRVAYRGCSFLAGCSCSCRKHDEELAGIQDGAAMPLRTFKLHWEKDGPGPGC